MQFLAEGRNNGGSAGPSLLERSRASQNHSWANRTLKVIKEGRPSVHNIYILRLCRQPGPLESKNGVGNLVAEQNSPQVSGLEADSSLGWQDSINMNLFNQNLRKRIFS